jgi:hypothetical protein
MNLNDKEVRTIYETISRVQATKMDSKLAYRLSKISGQIETRFKATEKTRMELIEKFKAPTPDPKAPFAIPQEKIDEFLTEFEAKLEAGAQEYDIKVIPFELFNDVKLDVAFFTNMTSVIEEPNEA